jgi:hypothetical protein
VNAAAARRAIFVLLCLLSGRFSFADTRRQKSSELRPQLLFQDRPCQESETSPLSVRELGPVVANVADAWKCEEWSENEIAVLISHTADESQP